MEKPIIWHKLVGETPLEALERLRVERPKLKDEPMTYAGRLDPMAEGVLLVLAGDTSDKDKFTALDKEYEFEVLWGISTDTYDILGLVDNGNPQIDTDKELIYTDEDWEWLVDKFIGKRIQLYPPFSSKPVSGKPLFKWAREGRLDKIDIPEREVEIYSLEHLGNRVGSSKEVLVDIVERVGLVHGDFRQAEILARWQEVLGNTNTNLKISKFRASVSSGTYIRSLARSMGEAMGVPVLAYSIKRTRVGEYSL